MTELSYDHLIGRPFTGLGSSDCFKLMRDLYADCFGISIPDFARPVDWCSDKLDLIPKIAKRLGMTKITEWRLEELRPGDILCLAIGEVNANHLAAYVGDDTILHHLYGRASTAEHFRDIWRTRTAYVLRHPEIPDLRPRYPDLDLMEYLNARTSTPTE